ncbi:ABC transporter ATP-binding protein, partial [Klebsiella pneumoniae]|nr:ABC transporter ATP-binding protein [Klebsiella pneumoniae]
FSDLQERRGTTFMFISHDLSVVEHLCSRLMIMYLGVIVEVGSREEIFSNPIHPYTKELLDAIPAANPRGRHALRQSDSDPFA